MAENNKRGDRESRFQGKIKSKQQERQLRQNLEKTTPKIQNQWEWEWFIETKEEETKRISFLQWNCKAKTSSETRKSETWHSQYKARFDHICGDSPLSSTTHSLLCKQYWNANGKEEVKNNRLYEFGETKGRGAISKAWRQNSSQLHHVPGL